MDYFKWLAHFTMALFFGMMIFVTYKAYFRKSGITGIDIAKVHILLSDSQKKQ